MIIGLLLLYYFLNRKSFFFSFFSSIWIVNLAPNKNENIVELQRKQLYPLLSISSMCGILAFDRFEWSISNYFKHLIYTFFTSHTLNKNVAKEVMYSLAFSNARVFYFFYGKPLIECDLLNIINSNNIHE